MSTCFTIAAKGGTDLEKLRQRNPYVTIEDEYFESLLPCFESIRLKTGKLIDLYDWLEFRGDELNIVYEEFKARKLEIDALTKPVVVSLGRQRNPDGSTTDLIYSLNPASISSLLQRILDLIGVAKIEEKVFICKGQ